VTSGLWIRLASPEVTEIAAEVGLDWICVDMEHGHLDWGDVHRHLAAAHGTGLGVLVRIAGLDLPTLKRALDLGADAVVVPLVRTAEEVRFAVDASRYPPAGARTLGQERAMRWGLAVREYVEAVADGGMVIPVIETPEAADAIDEIVAVDGVDAIFIGTGDLSAARGFVGQWRAPEIEPEIARIRAAADRHGVTVGIVAGRPDAVRRCRDEGVPLLGLGYDTDCFIAGLRDIRAAADPPRPVSADDTPTTLGAR
jgi:2-keto-3-deoxy-L-rhamnonate aldolase RhmA